jgi:hypothetical protein
MPQEDQAIPHQRTPLLPFLVRPLQAKVSN